MVGSRARKPETGQAAPGWDRSTASGNGRRTNGTEQAWRNGPEPRNSNSNNNNRDGSLRRSGNDVWRNSLERRNNAVNSEQLWRNGPGRPLTEQLTKGRELQLVNF